MKNYNIVKGETWSYLCDKYVYNNQSHPPSYCRHRLLGSSYLYCENMRCENKCYLWERVLEALLETKL